MPGLFDQVKDATLNIFGGRGEALTQAGAAALVASGQGATGLEAIGQAAQTGMQVRMFLEEKALQEKNRQDLAALVQEAGLSPGGLQRIFLEALGNGQIEEARAISEVLKSMGAGAQPRSLSFSTHDVVNPETGATETFRVGMDPYSGQEVSRQFIGAAPEDSVYERVETIELEGVPTRVGIEKGTGRRIIIGPEAQSGGTGGAEAQRRRALAQATQNSVDALMEHAPLLAQGLTGVLAAGAAGDGPVAGVLNWALGAFSPDAQKAAAARAQAISTLTPLLSGAAMTDAERATYAEAFMPVFGDNTAGTLAQKQVALSMLVQEFTRGGINSKGDVNRILSLSGLALPDVGGTTGMFPPKG